MISYEGEHAMVELVQALDEGKPLSEVSNLIWMDDRARCRSTKSCTPSG